MAYAVTHVLLSVILVDLYRDYIAKSHKKLFTIHTVFLAGLGGLLPDIDIPLGWFLNFFGISLLHRTYTHTLAFALLFLIPGIILWLKRKHRSAVYFFVIAFGIVLHLIIDMLFTGPGGGVMLLWPLSSYEFHSLINVPVTLAAGIDSVILLFWLYHEEIKHKILDYI